MKGIRKQDFLILIRLPNPSSLFPKDYMRMTILNLQIHKKGFKIQLVATAI